MNWQKYRQIIAIALVASSVWLLFSVAIGLAQSAPDTVDAFTPDAPTLEAPLEGALVTGVTHPPLGVPTLSWTTVLSATGYQVQISTSSGFGTTVVSTETSNPSYTPIIALGDGVFYWRARAKAGYTWGPYSEEASFTVSWSHNGEIFPVLLAPEDGATFAAFAHTHFTWQPVPGAATYQFRIATDPQMVNAAYTAVTTKPQHTPLTRLGNNVYYWQVTPVDNKGHAGALSPIWRFTFAWSTPPTLLSPVDEAALPFVPRFAWAAVEAAKEYRLQISTQENFNTYDQIVTRNTDYTPVDAFSNDQDYFWRVQAVDKQNTASSWSEIRRFIARWSFKPQLLSPGNNSIQLAYPFFAWTPAPGAEQYQIQIANNNSFSSPIVDTKLYNATQHTQPQWATAYADTDYYWHVRAIDAQNNYGPWSDVWSFRFSDPVGLLNPASIRPTTSNLIYPLPYYAPDAANQPVHGDRSFGVPIFIWDVAHDLPGSGSANTVEPADFYRLEVDDDPAFQSLNFTIDTAGLAAAPTTTHPFANLQDGAIYYWRVTAFRDNLEIGNKVTWTTRYNASLAPAAIAANAEPIFPADGFEAVKQPPVLGWLPVSGAAHYRVELARNAAFTSIVETIQAQAARYVPWQGQLTAMPFGAYWWRVRAEDGGNAPLGAWSTPRHFNLSVEMAVGNPYDYVAPDNLVNDVTGRARVATTPIEGLGAYELADLFTIIDRRTTPTGQNWVVAFNVGATATDIVRYALYFDTDHVANSGGATDPLGNTAINPDAYHRPEYVIYVDLVSGAVTAQFFTWNTLTDAWNPPEALTIKGGSIAYFPAPQSIQMFIPYTALDSANEDWVGSLALAVYALDGNSVRDSVPKQGATLDNPVFISNMLMPLYPFDTPFSNPIVYTDMPPLRWRMPAYGVDGYLVQVARDPQFTDIVETWETYETSTTPVFNLMPTAFQSREAYANNESYYWRVRMRHERFTSNSKDYDSGPWSPPMRFKLDSRQVGNPQLSTSDNVFMTPTFIWERVEGASGYTIQIDDDANFSDPMINQATDATSYTPQETQTSASLAPGTQYYWRVAMRRSDSVIGHWTDAMAFTKSSLAPELVAPTEGATLDQQPTLQWQAVLTPTTQPRLAAPSYRVQIANNTAFNPVELDQTTESTSYTPPKTKTLANGVWYWRVSFVDANSRVHPLSPTRSFTETYPLPTLIRPTQGENTGEAPIFTWAPVDGAAYYKLEYADNSSYNKSTSVTTDATTNVPTKALTGSPYFWRVQMFDADKNPGPLVDGRFIGGYSVYLPLASKTVPDPIVEPIVFDYYRATGCTDAPAPAGVTPQTAAAPITGIGLDLHVLNGENKALRVETLSADGQAPSYPETLASNNEQLHLVYSSNYETGEVCVAPLPTGAYSFRVFVNNVQLATGSFTIESATATGAIVPDQTSASVLKLRRIGQPLR